jgi:hypothetical protein
MATVRNYEVVSLKFNVHSKWTEHTTATNNITLRSPLAVPMRSKGHLLFYEENYSIFM